MFSTSAPASRKRPISAPYRSPCRVAHMAIRQPQHRPSLPRFTPLARQTLQYFFSATLRQLLLRQFLPVEINSATVFQQLPFDVRRVPFWLQGLIQGGAIWRDYPVREGIVPPMVNHFLASFIPLRRNHSLSAASASRSSSTAWSNTCFGTSIIGFPT